jgi:hypothetical protein
MIQILKVEQVVSEFMLAMETPEMYDFEFDLACKAIRNTPEGKNTIIPSGRGQWYAFEYRYGDIFGIEEDDRSTDKIILKNNNFNYLRQHFGPYITDDLYDNMRNVLTGQEFKKLVKSKRLENKERINYLEEYIKNKYAFELSQEEQKLKELHREVRRLRAYVKELHMPRATK